MGMGLGGTEKTLVSALNALDHSKYDVTLYIRKNRVDLLPCINKRVQIILNNSAPEFENSFYCRVCNIAKRFCDNLKLKSLSTKIARSARKYVLRKRTEYEKETFFRSTEYDYAIAYDMATEVVKFTLNCINAKQKIAFFHASRLYNAKMLLYKNFDKIVCVNDVVASDMKSDYPQLASKVLAVENYISPEYIYNELNNSEPLKRPITELVLCSCGRIAKEKGFDLAVKAAKLLKDDGVSFHWYFVGDYRDGGIVKEMIAVEGLQEDITVTGFVSNPYKYMNLCDIYIQPSWEDAHATTVVEAAILCKPIISTDTSTGRLFRDKYGCCNVCDKKEKSLAKAIYELYNNQSEQNKLLSAAKNIDYSGRYLEYHQAINTLFSGDKDEI